LTAGKVHLGFVGITWLSSGQYNCRLNWSKQGLLPLVLILAVSGMVNPKTGNLPSLVFGDLVNDKIEKHET